MVLLGTLVRDSSRKFIDMCFKPEGGATYTTVNFTGICSQTKITVSGSTACEYLIEGKHVEVGKEPEEVTNPEFSFPATLIGVVFFSEAEVSTWRSGASSSP